MQLFQYRHQGQVQIGWKFGEKSSPHGLNFTKALQAFQREALGREQPPIHRIETFLEEYLDLDNMIRQMAAFLDNYHGRDSLLLEEAPEILPPLSKPGKILCIGKNYVKHAEETGSVPPSQPVYFGKTADCIIGPGDTIQMPRSFGRVDPEIELAVVIGRPGFRVHRNDAMDLVAGYTILNDVTARDLQSKAKDEGHPWFASKNYATFCPIGPYLTLKEYIRDPHDLEMVLSINGEVRQEENTKQMIFSIPVLIETLSHQLPLRPGDIIATGTPHGISPLEDGDVLELSIAGLGTLMNRVKAID